jgi:hypothetical protein
MTVNVENVRKWVDALRSGEYEQTTGVLRKADGDGNVVGYCCLGVACEVSGLGKWERRLPEDQDEQDYYVVPVLYGEEDSWSELPDPVVEWLGFALDEENDEVGNPHLLDPDGNTYSATQANDRFHWSFAEIADALERTYLS